MLLALEFIILFCVVVFFRVRWGHVKRYWAERNVPHCVPNPIMGSLTFLQRENPATFMKKMYEDFKSPYVGMWLFWRPALIVNSPELARKVLVKDADNFRNRFLSSGKTDPTGGLNLFTVNDPTWSSIRRRLTTVFTAAKLRALQGLTLKKSGDLVHRIKNEMQTGEIKSLRVRGDSATEKLYRYMKYLCLQSAVCEHIQDRPNHYIRFDRPQILAKEHRFLPRMIREAIEIKKHPNFNREDGWMVPPAWEPVINIIKSKTKHHTARPQDIVIYSDFTTDVFGEAAFGLLSEATRTGDSVMNKVTKDFMEFSIFRGLSWCSIFFFPELVDFFGFTFFPKHTIKYLKQVLHTIIEQRCAGNREIKHSKDLLDALLKMKNEAAEDGEVFNEDVILAQAAIFLLGGFDTSASILTWASVELCHQPDLQEKLYNELLEAKQRVGGKDFDSTTLAELPYLNAVIKETLRKFPPMGWLDRIAAKNYEIDDKLTIQAGTVVYVNAIGMHWDPVYFPEPEKFDADRFLPDNEASITPYTYMPFGDGPRNCIGMRFAYQTLRFGLSSIILNYQVRPSPATPMANEVLVEKKGMFLMPGQDVPIQLISRN